MRNGEPNVPSVHVKLFAAIDLSLSNMSLLKRLEVPHEGGTIPDPWINNDIKPVEAGRRKWGFWTFNYYCTNDNDSIASRRGIID
jgi:cytosine/uracil/thiamine/allantoin permease